MFKSWQKENIITDSGEEKEAIAPVIISASRSTDIPAFYSKWLMERIQRGYMIWKNPFNQQKQYVSFSKVRLFVFWSKNPNPLIKCLKELDGRNVGYYFQYTLNDYEKEKFEPGVPPLEKRVDTFKKLSEQIGKEKVVWRFDPLILTDSLNVDLLLSKIKKVGDLIHDFTQKLVFSFADISVYRKVLNNLKRERVNYIEFDKQKMEEFAQGVAELNRDWNLQLATCCEEINLEEYNIEHNRCIDDNLIVELFKEDKILMDFLGYEGSIQDNLFDTKDSKGRPYLKDKGQRKVCGCIVSKDIGEYNTCNHLCVYCYANTSKNVVKKNIAKHEYTNEGIICVN